MNRIISNMRAHMWPVGKICTLGCATTLDRRVVSFVVVSAANANFSAGTQKVSYDPAKLTPGPIAEAIRPKAFSCNHNPEA